MSIANYREDGLASSTAIKGPCRAATTAGVTLAGEQTIDGVACVAGDRVLVKDQSNGVENGIYVVDSGNWRRATDFEGNRDVRQGTRVFIVAGTVSARRDYFVTTANPVVIDSSAVAFDGSAPAQTIDASQITGDLALSNLTQGAGLSVLGVAGGSTADHASITAGSDHQTLRRSGTTLGFGALNLAQAAAVTGELAGGNVAAATTSARGAVEKATDAEVYAATADKFLAADHLETASGEVTLTDGASPSFDWDAGINRVWTLAANRACPNPSNGQPGTYRTVRVIGNDTTDRTLTFGTQYEGDLPVLTDIDSTQQYLLTIRSISSSHFLVTAINATVS